jgi:hypothetical protein
MAEVMVMHSVVMSAMGSMAMAGRTVSMDDIST